MKRRRVVVIVSTAALALVGVGAVARPGIAADLMHPRDVEAFHSYLQTYGVQHWDAQGRPDPANTASAVLRGHETVVLAEGDRACAWLHARPDAPPTDPTGRSSGSEMTRAYVAATTFPELATTPGIRFSIVTSAWNNLCWHDMHDKTSPKGTHD